MRLDQVEIRYDAADDTARSCKVWICAPGNYPHHVHSGGREYSFYTIPENFNSRYVSISQMSGVSDAA